MTDSARGNRPTPEAMLALAHREAGKSQCGRLKIFLGACTPNTRLMIQSTEIGPGPSAMRESAMAAHGR